jgi:hypothetical protein
LLTVLVICAKVNDAPTIVSERMVHLCRKAVIHVGPIARGKCDPESYEDEHGYSRYNEEFLSSCHFPTIERQALGAA